MAETEQLDPLLVLAATLDQAARDLGLRTLVVTDKGSRFFRIAAIELRTGLTYTIDIKEQNK